MEHWDRAECTDSECGWKQAYPHSIDVGSHVAWTGHSVRVTDYVRTESISRDRTDEVER
jgi:hypothetical protein